MDLREIKKLLEAFDKSTANILEYENEEFRIYLDKSASAVQTVAPQAVQQVQAAPVPAAQTTVEAVQETKELEGELITSPMVGTFYQAPSPDSPPYVKVGDKVKKGQTLCIIEAMKIMNELEAEFDCEILEILVEDGQPVEFDTPLFRVKRV
ncbi:acetyl-CoA carboxylase, biotin carboxyl carrier protein [Nautilia profundicola AmH]|uniref:Biotin carboxyl carrier protein of acetyl-CoA carboxylase n=1 Tax=Nautilia profundicola (strain ATCC BAA-1463 / DSM 18972 / AmH) TaxID=598659 RepID=B9L791_NAUPA|nr:acetyl-CoA carboxylase biotin carboxyl carrier protein [Nautilia profundicola]ACM93042.1 acetyl-CoA carboxylase, biotin carboxyl carrier protein [Nautilia profundicola AmH]